MKKIFFILFTLVAFISYGQSPLTDVNGKVITSATGDILVQEADPNNFEYTPNAEWMPVNGVADNEIWILAFDGSGDRYSSFTCTTESSVDYAMDIYGGADGKTLLQTIDTASGKPINFRIPTGTGKYCYSEGYYTYKLVVRSTNPAKSILTFIVAKHPSTSITYNNWKIINFGTRNITSLSCMFLDDQTPKSTCPNLLYINTYYCSLISGDFCFALCSLLNQVTMAKTMNKLVYMGYSTTNHAYGTFHGCTSIKKIVFPERMNSLKTLGSASLISTYGVCASCTSLELVVLPDNLPSLTNLSGLITVFDSFLSATGSFYNCTSLRNIVGLKSLPVLSSCYRTFNSCSLLPSIPTISNVSIFSGSFLSINLRALTTFNQPILRCSSFTLTGTNNADRSNINYIQIDWANSQFTGNVDIRYNNLSATELNRIFTELPTVVVSRTIYVASNVGSATCDPTIATAKNWVVVIS